MADGSGCIQHARKRFQYEEGAKEKQIQINESFYLIL
jgi:hypothetical protein